MFSNMGNRGNKERPIAKPYGVFTGMTSEAAVAWLDALANMRRVREHQTRVQATAIL